MWDNGDLVTHEVMGGLKNVYAIGAGKIHTPLYLPINVEHYLICHFSA